MNETKLVCRKCQTELKPAKIGVLTIETASFGPYKVWPSDLYECPGCHVQIVTGFPDAPLRQDHFKPDFSPWLERQKEIAPLVVYDHERPQPIAEGEDAK